MEAVHRRVRQPNSPLPPLFPFLAAFTQSSRYAQGHKREGSEGGGSKGGPIACSIRRDSPADLTLGTKLSPPNNTVREPITGPS